MMPSLPRRNPILAILEDKVALAQIFEDYPNAKGSHIAIKEPSEVGAKKMRVYVVKLRTL
jgi:hypothetical protein